MKRKPITHYTQGDDNACNWGKQIGDKLTADPKKVNCERCLDFIGLKRDKGYKAGYNEFLVVVGYTRQHKAADPERFILHGRVSADMAIPPPVPELTIAEMQSVAFAAKMALAKVMANRKKK